MQRKLYLVTKHLFAQISSSEVHFGVFLLLDLWHVNYGQILTGKMKIAPLGALERMRLATCMPTLATIESKLGVFEFRLACYQWGNSWCLYSLCLIGRRLGFVRLLSETIG